MRSKSVVVLLMLTIENALLLVVHVITLNEMLDVYYFCPSSYKNCNECDPIAEYETKELSNGYWNVTAGTIGITLEFKDYNESGIVCRRTATYEVEMNKIKLPSGLRCNFLENHCRVEGKGIEAAWKQQGIVKHCLEIERDKTLSSTKEFVLGFFDKEIKTNLKTNILIFGRYMYLTDNKQTLVYVGESRECINFIKMRKLDINSDAIPPDAGEDNRRIEKEIPDSKLIRIKSLLLSLILLIVSWVVLKRSLIVLTNWVILGRTSDLTNSQIFLKGFSRNLTNYSIVVRRASYYEEYQYPNHQNS